MAEQWFFVCNVLVTLLILILFIFGRWPIFRGTFIERIHCFLFSSAFNCIWRYVVVAFGTKGINAVLSIKYYCCDRPNPILQVIYLAVLASIYYIIAESSFSYLPGYYLSEIHKYTSLLAIGLGIFFFLLASFSDPGTVNAENVTQYLSAYPYDNIIFSEKECPTCKIPKPARSKHCSICDRCVARFDHHCAWMNNCIGERNARYFIAFLIWHFLLCIYGTIVIALILAGQLKELKVIYILTVYYGIENSFRSLAPHVVQWLLGSHDIQVILVVFLALVSVIIVVFLGFHISLCLKNTTTNEIFKWQDYISWQKKENETKARATTVDAGTGAPESSSERKPSGSKWTAFFRRSSSSEPEHVKFVKKNIYDKGFFNNFKEIIFPLSTRPSFSQMKSKSG